MRGRMKARMRAEMARWTKMTTIVNAALEVKYNWSVLATSCSFSQSSWFAKKVLEQSGSGL